MFILRISFGVVVGAAIWYAIALVATLFIILWGTVSYAQDTAANAYEWVQLYFPIFGACFGAYKEIKKHIEDLNRERLAREKAAQARKLEQKREEEARKLEQKREEEARKLMEKQLEEEREGERRALELVKRQAIQLLEQEKEALRQLATSTTEIYSDLPNLASAAESFLNQAEVEFAEGAYIPFWEAIEQATQNLAAFRSNIQYVTRNVIEHQRRSSDLSSPITKLTLPKGQLPDSGPASQRLSRLVRLAHKSYEFSSIYQQRKTNQILVAGFGTLGDAINCVGFAIRSSINELSDSLNSSIDEIMQVSREAVSATERQTEFLRENSEKQAEMGERHAERHAEMLKSLREGQEKASSERREHASKQAAEQAADAVRRREHDKQTQTKLNEQSEMLDNIQRGRKPWP